jgi:hypothetical protein
MQRHMLLVSNRLQGGTTNAHALVLWGWWGEPKVLFRGLLLYRFCIFLSLFFSLYLSLSLPPSLLHCLFLSISVCLSLSLSLSLSVSESAYLSRGNSWYQSVHLSGSHSPDLFADEACCERETQTVERNYTEKGPAENFEAVCTPGLRSTCSPTLRQQSTRQHQRARRSGLERERD